MAMAPLSGIPMPVSAATDTSSWWDTAAGEQQNSGGGILYETPSDTSAGSAGNALIMDEDSSSTGYNIGSSASGSSAGSSSTGSSSSASSVSSSTNSSAGSSSNSSAKSPGSSGGQDGDAPADKLDFSSMRLIVGADNSSIIRAEDDVLSSYDGVYLLQYKSAEEAEGAYDWYADRADFVSPDTEIVAADDADVKDGEEVQADTDALTALKEAVKDSDTGSDENKDDVNTDYTNVIAVLDTGYTTSDDTYINVIDEVSMLGDDTEDDNGHATKVINEIVSSNPAAYIMSVKVLDKNGKGNTSSVYAGIQYAVSQGAGIILLPMYAYGTADNAAVEEAVNTAEENGITVVGAAGNDGRNAKYYVPGRIDSAVIVGACDQDGNRLKSSNYGDTVDYYVAQTSTSLASARFAGLLSSCGKKSFDDAEENMESRVGIFTPDKLTGETVGTVNLSVDTSGLFQAAGKHTSMTVTSEHDIAYYSTAGFGGGWNTGLYTTSLEDGSSFANTYCIDPSKSSPPIGRTFTDGNNSVIYTITDANIASFAAKTSPTDDTPSGQPFDCTTMVKLMYYGYGGPGHNSIDAQYRSTNGGLINKARDICLTHLALAQQANWCANFGVSLGSFTTGLGSTALGDVIAYTQYIQGLPDAFKNTDWEMTIMRSNSYPCQSLCCAKFGEIGDETGYDPGFLTFRKTTQSGSTGINGVNFYVKYTPDPDNVNITAKGKAGTQYEDWTPDKRAAAGDYQTKTWVFTTKTNPINGQAGWIDWIVRPFQNQSITAEYYHTGGDTLNYFQGNLNNSPVPVFWPGTYEVWEDAASAESQHLAADTRHYVGHVTLNASKTSATFQWDSPGFGQSLALTTGGNFTNEKYFPASAKSQAYVDSTKTQAGSTLPDGSREIVVKDILYIDGFMEYESDVPDSALKLDGKLIDVSAATGGNVLDSGSVLATGKFVASGGTSLQLSSSTVKNYQVDAVQNRTYTYHWETSSTWTDAKGNSHTSWYDHYRTQNAANPSYTFIKGEVMVEYRFTISDPKEIEGHTLVVSTSLSGLKQSEESVDLGTHDASSYDEPGVGSTGVQIDLKDAKDANETVNFPKIRTVAFDNNSTDHTGTVGDKIQITDVVRYTNLRLQGNSPSVIKGSGTDYWKVQDKGKTEWKIKGYLMYKDSSTAPDAGAWKPYSDENGPVTAEKEFTPSAADGTESITFRLDGDTFNALDLSNKDTTCWEELYVKNPATNEWVLAAEHVPGKNTWYSSARTDDENEQLHFPEIHTTLYQNDVTKGDAEVSQNASASGNTMTYSNPGTTGINDRSTQLNQRAQERKQYDSTNPDVSKKPTYDDHADGQAASTDTFITYVDRVTYSNLIPGHTYVMESTLWGKETLRDADTSTEEASNPARPVRGEYLDGYTDASGTYHEGTSTNGIVTGRTIFTPATANMPNGMASGTVDVKIVFNSNYAPGTLIVAFEDLKVRTLNDSGKAVYTGFIEAGSSDQYHGSKLTDDKGSKNGDVKKTGWGNNSTDDSVEYVESNGSKTYRNDITDTGNRRPSGEAIVVTHSDINDKGQSIMTEFANHLHAGGRGTAMFYIAAAILAGAAVLLIVRKKRKQKGLPGNVG